MKVGSKLGTCFSSVVPVSYALDYSTSGTVLEILGLRDCFVRYMKCYNYLFLFDTLVSAISCNFPFIHKDTYVS